MLWLVLACDVARAELPGSQSPVQSPVQNPAMHLSMPFSCAVEHGQLRVTPAAEQIYDIAARVESQLLTTCQPGRGGTCASIRVHRFSVHCNGGQVPWIEIAAAAAATRPASGVEFDDGRLSIARPRTQAARHVRDCYARLSGAAARFRINDQDMLDDCWGQPRRSATTAAPVPSRIVLPQGFAPTSIARARLLPAGRPPIPAPVEADVLTHLPPPAPERTAWVAALVGDTGSEAGSEISPAGRFAMRAPPPDDAMPATVTPASAAGSGWRTEVVAVAAAAEEMPVRLADHAVDTLPADSEPAWHANAFWAAIATGLGSAALLAWAGVRAGRRRGRDWYAHWHAHWQAPRHRPGALALALPGADARMVAVLRTNASSLLPVIRERLDLLSPAMPLRQVLARELATAGQRLQILEAESSSTTAHWRRTRQRLQAVVRDLQRLKEITVGAHSSLGAGAVVAPELPEPRDKIEAYAMLGVNPDVNQRILKKLVEALRQGWHPDLARDDADRRRREDRIKQINVAWDLIQGKRAEA